MVRIAVALVAVTLIAGGCASRRGDEGRVGLRMEARFFGEWHRQYDRSVREQWAAEGPRPSKVALERTARRVARRYGMDLVRLTFLDPAGRWPRLVLRARADDAHAHAVPAVLARLDRQLSDTRSTYSGFMLSVRDRDDIPFLVASRADSEGGTWARTKRLDPFVHGL
jgi:hypothetical protein